MTVDKRGAHFEYWPVADYGRWEWWLIDVRGKVVATSSGTYSSRTGARQAARRLASILAAIDPKDETS